MEFFPNSQGINWWLGPYWYQRIFTPRVQKQWWHPIFFGIWHPWYLFRRRRCHLNCRRKDKPTYQSYQNSVQSAIQACLSYENLCKVPFRPFKLWNLNAIQASSARSYSTIQTMSSSSEQTPMISNDQNRQSFIRKKATYPYSKTKLLF